MEPDDEILKFRLTQGYYVAQLLEYNSSDFNPISEDAFRDAVFYIDTNVIIGKILSDDIAQLIDELVKISQALGICLRVTRATIDEARNAASSRLDDLDGVLTSVPIELLQKSDDQFLKAFLALRHQDPRFTPQEFLARFDAIPQLLTELGIELQESTIDEIVGTRDLSRECKLIGHAAERIRRRPKHPRACLHDAGHFVLVQKERLQKKKAWFLTRDKTLNHAAVELDKEHPPFCFPLLGFIQSVSPFL